MNRLEKCVFLGTSNARSTSVKSNANRWIFGLIVVGALVLIVENRTETEELTHVVERARPAWLLLAAALQAATYPCIAVLWTRVIRRLDGRTPRLGKLIALTMAELFTDQTVPSGGMSGTVLVVRALEGQGVTKGAATAAVLTSLMGFYLAQLVAVVGACLTLLALGRFGGWEATATTLAFVAAFAMPIPLVLMLMGALHKLPERLQNMRAIRDLREHVDGRVKAVVFSRSVVGATALRLAVILLDGATLAVALAAMGHPLAVSPVVAAYVLAYVVASASFLPGGIGPFEVTATTLLVGVGARWHVAASATLLMRGLSFWLPMLPGAWFARASTTRRVLRDA